jgi:hypothetical protein
MGHPGVLGCLEENRQRQEQERATATAKAKAKAKANTGVLRCAQNDEVLWRFGREQATAKARTGNGKSKN